MGAGGVTASFDGPGRALRLTENAVAMMPYDVRDRARSLGGDGNVEPRDWESRSRRFPSITGRRRTSDTASTWAAGRSPTWGMRSLGRELPPPCGRGKCRRRPRALLVAQESKAVSFEEHLEARKRRGPPLRTTDLAAGRSEVALPNLWVATKPLDSKILRAAPGTAGFSSRSTRSGRSSASTSLRMLAFRTRPDRETRAEITRADISSDARQGIRSRRSSPGESSSIR